MPYKSRVFIRGDREIRAFVKYWLILYLYMLVIFALSSLSKIPLPESGAVSMDKFYHSIEYGILGYLMWRAFRRSSWGLLNRHPFLYALILSSLYGASDEIHQSFVLGREASVADWLFDILGSFLVVLGLFYLRRLRLQKG